MQNDRLVLAQQIAIGDTEQNSITNLTGSTGNGNANGGLHVFELREIVPPLIPSPGQPQALTHNQGNRTARIRHADRRTLQGIAVRLRWNRPAITRTPGQRGSRPRGSAAPESRAANVPGFSNNAT